MLGHIEQESTENYLETIYILSKKSDRIRAIDIAKYLNLSRASVSRALSLLQDEKFVIISDTGLVSLSELGQQRAISVYTKHTTLAKLFIAVAHVSVETADVDACRIEHVISDETMAAIDTFLSNNPKFNIVAHETEHSYIPNEADLTESAENYLEEILRLNEKTPNEVRAIHIANELGLSRASVSRALTTLEQKGFITKTANNRIIFTQTGLMRAQRVYARHVDLTTFLAQVLGVDATIAEKDACRIEHFISSATINGIRLFLTQHIEKQ